ncbi:MAG TPA: transglycosylase domain-containing protein [Mycobacteriales bacterium]|nr:transglycosylase domain-containing protein [Mycobacteriales bacterium]
MTAPARAPRDVVKAVAERRSRSARLRRRRRQVVLWLVLAIIAGTVTFAAGLLAAPVDYSFQPEAPQAVILLDSAGKPFATIRSPQNEQPVVSKQIPQVLKDAFVAAEDERFFSHSGVDAIAAVRALWRDITGAQLQGGSTITQQYVKNVYTGDQRTALRKLREASLAVRLEQHLSKEEILTRYLNTLYLGNGTAGVQAASLYYYGVPVTDLDYDRSTGKHSFTLALSRAATLAGIGPAPSVWNPVHAPKLARARELYVLNRMIANHMITPQQASDAYGSALPRIVAQSEPDAPTIAPEFRDMVEERLKQVFATNYDSEMFDSGGVRVTTTLDLNLQKAAVQALHQVLPSVSDPWAAVAAIDPRNGDIRALTTKIGRGYKNGGLNLANGIYRSSGSTIKPFTLAEALIRGHSLDEAAYAPECLNVGVGYHVCNAEKGSSYQTLRTALVQSINTVYAPLGVKVGLQRVVNLATAAGMDIKGINCYAKGNPCASFSLGMPTNALGEAVAYGTLVNHGVHHAANSLLDVQSGDDGDVFDNRASRLGEQVIPRKVADEVASVMRDVVSQGTGTAAQQPFPVAGKTGTTDDFTNAWFTGCSSTLCISVWMGYDKQYVDHGRVPHSMKNVEGTSEVFGGTLPAKIFARIFSDYRALQRPTTKPSTSASPTQVQTFRPATHSATPRSTKSAHPSPTPSKTAFSPPAQPSTTPSPSILPSPP